MMIKKATILKLDDQGYGFTRDEVGQSFTVPYTLPEEEVEIETRDGRWYPKKIIKASPKRITPPCPYYGTCGGCVLQHLSVEAYADYKIERILRALKHYGIEDAIIEPLTILNNYVRRRAVFHALKTSSEIKLGYYQLGSHHLVDIEHCLLLRLEINQLIASLKEVLLLILKPKEKVDIFLTATETGIDLLLKIKENKRLELPTIDLLKTFASTHNLARLIFLNDQEEWPIVTFKTPQVRFGDYSVEVSADGFLQTSSEADQLLTSLVLESFPSDHKKIADLFCGRGTFSLPLSEKGKVDAYEMDNKALKALTQAAKVQKLPIQTYVRNLFSDPLKPEQLDSYQSVVLNPPRQGAAAQVKMLAMSNVSHVVMVSCNPDTFARDVALLQKGGFQLQKLNPVDQFLWSPHIEIVTHLRR